MLAAREGGSRGLLALCCCRLGIALLGIVFVLEGLKVEASTWNCAGLLFKVKEVQKVNSVNWERKTGLLRLLWLQFSKLQESRHLCFVINLLVHL